jgi:aldose sugar dehydrogenase
MTFVGPNDILVTEKDAGTVRRIVNGTELQQPVLNASVATCGHRGMLGIVVASHSSSITAISTNRGNRNNTTTYVFLYYTRLGHIQEMTLQKENNLWVIEYTGTS